MPVNLSDIPGVMIEKVSIYGHTECLPESEKRFNKAIDQQSSVKIGLNREKLAKTLFYKWENPLKEVFDTRWKQLSDFDKIHWYGLADAIIAKEHEILEVK